MTLTETDALLFKHSFRDAIADLAKEQEKYYTPEIWAVVNAKRAKKAKQMEAKYGKGRAYHRHGH